MSVSIAQSWRPRDAWLFAGFALLLSILGGVVLFAVEAAFPSSIGFMYGLGGLLGLFVVLGVSLFFAQVRSRADFVAAFGLTRPSEMEILVAVAAGMLIQLAGIALFGRGLSHIQIVRTFQPIIVAVLAAPFFEEPAMRGFAYRAFRNSYSSAASVCLVVGINLVFHWGQIHRSIHSCTVIALLNMTLCLLRERHWSLWSCIACHLAFNAIYAVIEHHQF